MVPASILVAAAMTVPAPATGADLPTPIAVQEALNEREKCRGLTGPECPPPYRQYEIHGAKCIAITPENDRPSATCRVDLTLLYPDPSQNTRHRDSCLRFARLGAAGKGPAWTVLQIRDRPCEMPTALKRDPNAVPKRDALEQVLADRYVCDDFDGSTHCGDQPEGASIESFRCKPLRPGSDGRARAACRVTGKVTSTSGRRLGQMSDSCVRLERITAADESPAYWVADYVPEKKRCEIR